MGNAEHDSPGSDAIQGQGATNAQVWDREQLLERCLGNENLVQMLLGSFRGRLRGIEGDLQEALRKADFESVKDLVHRLKGEAANLGAMQIFHAAANCEPAGPESARELSAEQLERILHACRNFENQVTSVA